VGIGLLREGPLHASLKEWYSETGDGMEVPVDGYVIDLVRVGLLIEVQTSGFAAMKKKLLTLIDLGHEVRIVHPLPVDKWIVKVDDSGATIDRRLSPRHRMPFDVFAELVSFPEALAKPNLSIALVMTREEEVRRFTPDRSWRRRGWTVVERRLLEVIDTQPIDWPDDLADLMPADLPDPFITADIATGWGRPLRVAQQAVFCLRATGVVSVVGKRGNSVEYRLPTPGLR
jgi:hypothetical protein